MSRPRNTTCQPRLRKRGKIYQIYFTSNGSTKSISTRTSDRASAELALAEFIKQSQTAAAFSAVPTIAEILDDYLAEKERAGKEEGAKYQVIHLKAFFKTAVVQSITETAINAYKSFRSVVKENTIRRELSTLNAALNRAKRKGVIDKVPYIPMPKQPAPREYWITKKEAERLFNAAKIEEVRTSGGKWITRPNPDTVNHLVVFIALAVNTLARKGAILGLTWDRVNFETGLINLIDPTVSETNKRRAIVPMNDTLRDILSRARLIAQSDHVVEYLGKPVKDIKRAFKRCAERAGLPKVTPHVLRHSGATWLAMAGIPIYEIARYLGHTDIKITYRVYAKYAPDYLRSAAAVLG